MEWLINRRRMMLAKKDSEYLPAGAVKIDYLESTGTQWIDTGITVTNGILMEYTFSFGEVNKPIVCINTNDSTKYIHIYMYNNYNVSVWKGQTANYVRVNPKLNVFHDYYYDTRGLSKVLIVDGSEKYNTDTTITVTSTSTVSIFNLNSDIATGKIKSLKLTNNNDEVVLDMIPVRIGQVGYMFDRVSGLLFGNSGSGDFVLGNDI